jgi:hypothetical protein
MGDVAVYLAQMFKCERSAGVTPQEREARIEREIDEEEARKARVDEEAFWPSTFN